MSQKKWDEKCGRIFKVNENKKWNISSCVRLVVWVGEGPGKSYCERKEPKNIAKDPKKKEIKSDKKLLNMGEEVTRSEAMPKNSAGTDETDKAAPVPNDESEATAPLEKCDANKTNADGCVQQPQAEKSPRKASTVPNSKPQDNSFEKSKKWYNISFMHRAGTARTTRCTSTTGTKNSIKMDNRHSWHLNDPLEMWVSLNILSFSHAIVPFWNFAGAAWVCLRLPFVFFSLLLHSSWI